MKALHLSVAVLALLAGCTSPSDGGAGLPDSPAPTGNVGSLNACGTLAPTAEFEIDNTGFRPLFLKVPLGTCVVWRNYSPHTHSVTSPEVYAGGVGIDSGRIAPGKTFSLTFAENKEFTFLCKYHLNFEGHWASYVTWAASETTEPEGTQKSETTSTSTVAKPDEVVWRENIPEGTPIGISYNEQIATSLASKTFEVNRTAEVAVILELQIFAPFWEETNLQPRVIIDGAAYDREDSYGNYTSSSDQGYERLHKEANYTWDWTHILELAPGEHHIQLQILGRNTNNGDYAPGAAPYVIQGFLRVRSF